MDQAAREGFVPQRFVQAVRSGGHLHRSRLGHGGPFAGVNQQGRRGYHRQEAFYTGISEQLLGVQRFIFGLVSKTEPHCTVLAEIDPIHHEIAFREIREDLEQLGECYRSGVWQDPMPRGIQMVEATAWQVKEGMN